MSGHFPLSWNEWIEGVHASYDLETALEARLAAGAELTAEEQHLLKSARRVTARYMSTTDIGSGRPNGIAAGYRPLVAAQRHSNARSPCQ